MDFDLSDWTADGHVLNLDKQLFGPKEQLTVFTVNKNSTKNKKRKLDKTSDAQPEKNKLAENGNCKKLKKDRLKQLKTDKRTKLKYLDNGDSEENSTERGSQKKKEKIVKRKNSDDADNGVNQSNRGSQKKKDKLLKRKHSLDADNKESQSDRDLQKKKTPLKRKYSVGVDNEESKSGNSIQKNKRKLLIPDSSPKSKNNNMLKTGKKMNLKKLKESTQDLKEKGTENIINSSKSKEELNSSEIAGKKKRKKKKKNSSKKNKYKHLDEERARLKQNSVGNTEDSVKKSSETVKVKENGKYDSPKTKTPEFNVSLGVSASKKKKKKKSLDTGCLEGPLGQNEQSVANNDHEVDGEGKHTKSSKNSPFNLSKLNKILTPKKLPKNDKTKNVVKEKSVDDKIDTQHITEKKKDKPVSLRDRMMEQLKSARFRYINEQLYTRSGSEAAELFKEDKESFHCYHEGFQNQVEKWPTNPVDVIIKQIKSGPSTAVIGDFGCGDAKIARSVPHKVHSFDLVALNEHVTVCNIQKVPLKNNSLDTAVFCLSLMGTNLAEYLEEANRVLRKGGTLMIAEVASRIEKTGKFIRNIERMGFRVNNRDTSNDMFILLDFMKIDTPGERLPEITLDPCVYKKR